MGDFTPYQQQIIKRYYNNLDTIARQRLAELVGDLYLARGAKRTRVWDAITSALKKVGMPESQIEHLRKQDNPSILAEIVSDMEKK